MTPGWFHSGGEAIWEIRFFFGLPKISVSAPCGDLPRAVSCLAMSFPVLVALVSGEPEPVALEPVALELVFPKAQGGTFLCFWVV